MKFSSFSCSPYAHSYTQLVQTKSLISPLSDVFQTTSPSFHYLGTVCHETNMHVIEQLKQHLAFASTAEVRLTVSSAGGPTGPAMCFYDTIRHILKPRLTTIGSGDVDSSGIIIFLAGTRRLMSPRTTLLLHEASRRFDGKRRYTARALEAIAREDRLKDEQYAQVIADNSTLMPQDVRTMMERETTLTAADCVKFGLAHELLS